MFREYTINSVSISQVHFEFTIESRIHCEFPNNFANLLNLTIFFAKKPWINNLSRDLTMNSLSVLLIHYEFIIDFANLLGIHYFLREFALNSLCFSRIPFEFTFNSLGILRFAMDLLVVSSSQWIQSFSRVQYEFTFSTINLL